MRIDDYCCLGRTVPEESKKYGTKVCSAGYSEELNAFVRVYPLPFPNELRQRTVSVLELERNCQDGRAESWRLNREAANNGIVSIGPQRPTWKVCGWLDGHISQSIKELNADRRSIGVIRPRGLECYFSERGSKKQVDPGQPLLWDDIDHAIEGGHRIQLAPRLRFRDEDGPHDLQLREWGCYEWLRNEPDRARQLWENLRLNSPNHDTLFVVGNMCNQRCAWLVISVYVRRERPGLFCEEAAP